MVELTVVMPAYNEEERIYRNLLEAARQIEKFEPSFRIVVVNDGSLDHTDAEVHRAMAQDSRIGLITYKHNEGKGYAVRRGMLAARSPYVAFLDSDLELPPYLLADFLSEARKGADVVIGSKMHPDSKLEYPLMRRILSVGYYIYLKVLFGMKLRDTQTGIKLFRTSCIRPILEATHAVKFSFDIEILARASRLGLTIKEMPVVVHFSRNRADRSKIRLSSIFQMFWDAIRIKNRLRREKYRVN